MSTKIHLRGTWKESIHKQEVGESLSSLISETIDWCKAIFPLEKEINIVLSDKFATYFRNKEPLPEICFGSKAVLAAMINGYIEYSHLHKHIAMFGVCGATGIRALQFIVLHEYAHARVAKGADWDDRIMNNSRRPHGHEFLLEYKTILYDFLLTH